VPYKAPKFSPVPVFLPGAIYGPRGHLRPSGLGVKYAMRATMASSTADLAREQDARLHQRELPFFPILVSVMISNLVVGLTLPVFPELSGLTGWAEKGEEHAGSLAIYYSVAKATGMFLTTKYLGDLSNQKGRKPFMMLGAVGDIIDFGGSQYVYSTKGGGIVLLCRFIGGLCGDPNSIGRSATVDISSSENTSKRLGILQATKAFGMITGPVVTAWIYSITGSMRLPLLICSGMPPF
jgi:MFS family permease